MKKKTKAEAKCNKGETELDFTCPACGSHGYAILRDLPDAVLPGADVLDLVMRSVVRCSSCSQQSVARQPK